MRERCSFDRDQIVVLGLRTVFEHRDVMGRDALAVFLSEYRIDFPVGIDRRDGNPVPLTTRHYGLRGTRSTVLIDRGGRLRHSASGTVDDLVLGEQLEHSCSPKPHHPPNRSSERPRHASVKQVSAAPKPTSHP